MIQSIYSAGLDITDYIEIILYGFKTASLYEN